MKIAKIETYSDRQVCIVRVETDDGSEGFGQTAPSNADIAATVLHRQIAPHALGADALAVEELSDRCIERNYKFPWSYVCRALGGVDTALWDLRGRLEGKSVCELLGGKPRPFPAYGSTMGRSDTPEQVADLVKRRRAENGFRAFKLRIGKVCGHDEDQWPGRTENLLSSVRRAVGDDVSLLVDANSC